ncbi:RtcB family protein [Lysobacter korlensis]|uniref:3'-phosphate/5'-hydroxy nucleic acid ligase n=1 Tax=Lysobacter korlensis TaxID=553636 RepID=A0ABV6RXG2_9GAMM
MRRINDRLLSWASILDPAAEAQASRTATMPFIHPHVALMPDAHLGLGATVGSVIPTLRAVMPAAVGVDIGCGMIAVRTQFSLPDIESRSRIPGGTLRRLRERVENAIPLSAGGRNKRIEPTAEPRIRELEVLATAGGFDPGSYSDTWRLQLGSLGSGNHFIEVSLDETDAVWLFLHSGSRGIGNRIAQHHIEVARRVAERSGTQLPDPDLAHLEEGTPQFDRYLTELGWAQHFALLNREEMMDRVIREFSAWAGEPVSERERINCHHNFTEESVQSGERVWLSRKGAISARRGELGLIPGSMGTASYVVEGLGNELALESSPHGAGRAYSRNAARKAFTHQQLREAMKGIEFRDTVAFLDEIPAAYKPIDRVMTDAADLVRVLHTLRQIVNVKGD